MVNEASAELSPEVQWYLDSRGYVLPEDAAVPKFRTPEPCETTPDAQFDPERVDRVIESLALLKHTKGRWAGTPLKVNAVQVAYFIAPVFGWVHQNTEGAAVRVVQEAYIEMPRKNAKALALGTPVLTQAGWKTIESIHPGDLVVHATTGAWTEVTAESEIFEERQLYTVTDSKCRSLTVDGEHLWTVYNRSAEKWQTVTTDKLIAQGLTYGARGDRRFSLPISAAVRGGQATGLSLDELYLLGYWLGDGFSDSPRFAVGREDIDWFLENIRHDHVRDDRGQCFVVSANRLRPILKRFNLLGNKHIPDVLLTAPFEERLALLQGLMDSDGTSGKKVSITMNKQGIMQSVLQLVRSLGFNPGPLQEGAAKIDGRDKGQYYRLTWTASTDDPPCFRLPRKLEKITGKVNNRRLAATITSIEPAGIGQAKCIAIAADDGLFLAGPDLIPTHNTTLASGLGVYLAFADQEAGAEVVFGAASKDQAGAAFRPVESLARASRVLQKAGIVATKSQITQPKTTSVLKVVSSRGDLAHGANIHGALIDELHVHKNPDLLEAIESGTGAREQPLTIIITTADDGQITSVYAQRRDMIEKVCRRVLDQPATYGVIFAADEADDPFIEATWQKANPLYPVTPSPEFMRKAADKAKANPVALASFLRLHLGLRAKQGSRFIAVDEWDRGRHTFKEASLYGRRAIGGLDLSSVSDLTALAWLFPDEFGGYDALYRFWLPEAALDTLDMATAKMASVWVSQGWITLTPGDVVDYDWIKSVIVDDATKFRVTEIGYDRWNSSQMVIDLQDKEGLNMTKVGQGVQSMSPALKELERLVKLGKFHAGDNPVMRWMVDNLRVASDPAGNIKPDKAKSLSKIDGVSATLDALFCAMNSPVQTQTSAYESGGLTVI